MALLFEQRSHPLGLSHLMPGLLARPPSAEPPPPATDGRRGREASAGDAMYWELPRSSSDAVRAPPGLAPAQPKEPSVEGGTCHDCATSEFGFSACSNVTWGAGCGYAWPSDKPAQLRFLCEKSVDAGTSSDAADLNFTSGPERCTFNSFDEWFAATHAASSTGVVDCTQDASVDTASSWSKDVPLIGQDCRWHKSASSVGVVSGNGHIFTKVNNPAKSKVQMNSRGIPMQLSSICMVFDSSLRCGGMHKYVYKILDGEVGKADGAGFVFDTQVRRNNLQRVRSVFLNQKGCVCLRDQGHVKKLSPQQLPPLAAGVCLTMNVDLDGLCLQFTVSSVDGFIGGCIHVSLGEFLNGVGSVPPPRSGFFCAVLTKDVSVALS